MHLALAKYPHVSSFPQKAYGSIDVREWDAAMDVLKGSDVARHVEILQLREKALRAHAEVESLRQSGSLSEQVIHTDLHPQNFLFQDERLNAIIDFGNASWGVLSVDIGMACHRLVRQHVVFCDRSPAVAIPDAVQSFLDAYCSINPSYGPMIGQLPLFMRELLLRKVGDVLLGHAAGRRIEVEAITEITKFGSLIDEVDMIETLGFAK